MASASKKANTPGQPALLRAMSDAVLAMTAAHQVERVLQLLAESARELAGARYAAIGIPDGEGGFAAFIHTGMSDELVAQIGPLPRSHGVLAAMLSETEPYRTPDIRTDPRFEWWPDAHPRMTSFLGVPVVSHGQVIAAFYLTDKIGASEFTLDDQATIEMLAAHAAIAIENARLYERSRELSVIEERNRLARELHDSVIQMLFSISLTAEAVTDLIDRSPSQAKTQAETLRDLAREASQEMRSLIFELRPAELESDGLLPTLRKHIDVVWRVSHKEIELRDEGYVCQPLALEKELFRIVQEALNNAVKHSEASHIAVSLGIDEGQVAIAVEDNGVGFNPDDPLIRTRRLGLTTMAERTEALGGRMRIKSKRGKGTRVLVEAPVAIE
jgi:signal transduction histidine kinase